MYAGNSHANWFHSCNHFENQGLGSIVSLCCLGDVDNQRYALTILRRITMNNETPGETEQKLLAGKVEKPVATARNATRKKPVSRKKAASSRRAVATRSRNELVKTLRKDLEDTRATLKAAKAAARAEAALLKDQLRAALKRERELVKISEKKIKKMIAAGERWEKKQIGKLKKAAGKLGIAGKN